MFTVGPTDDAPVKLCMVRETSVLLQRLSTGGGGVPGGEGVLAGEEVTEEGGDELGGGGLVEADAVGGMAKTGNDGVVTGAVGGTAKTGKEGVVTGNKRGVKARRDARRDEKRRG